MNTQSKENKASEKRFEKENPDYDDGRAQINEMLKSNPQLKHLVDNPSKYSSRVLTCKHCGHEFDRSTATMWETSANKIGEQITVEEYRELIDGN